MTDLGTSWRHLTGVYRSCQYPVYIEPNRLPLHGSDSSSQLRFPPITLILLCCYSVLREPLIPSLRRLQTILTQIPKCYIDMHHYFESNVFIHFRDEFLKSEIIYLIITFHISQTERELFISIHCHPTA